MYRCSRVSIADSQPVEGVNRVLKSNELMPLMGMLEKGQQQLSFCSSLYNTPLFQHEVVPKIHPFDPQLPSTDYLLTIQIES